MRFGGIRAVLFDFDGTLVDTETLYAQTFAASIIKMGFGRTAGFKTDRDIINFYRKKICGVRRENQRALLETTFPKMDITKFQEETYDRSFDELVAKIGVRAKPGVNAMFEYLNKKGITVAIASMSKREKIERFGKMAGIDLSRVALIAGGDDIVHAKPSPEIYIKCMEQLGIRPCDTVVVEDSTIGAWAGVNAGCHTVIVRDMAPLSAEIGAVVDRVLKKDCLIKLKELL